MNLIHTITGGEPKKLNRVITFGLLTAFLKALPYGVLIGAVLETMKPLLNPGTALNTGNMWLLYGLVVVLFLLQIIVGQIKYVSSFDDATKIAAKGRIRLAAHLRELPMGVYTKYDVGQLSGNLMEDHENILTLISDGIDPIFSSVVIPLAGLIGMAFINWKMALVMLLSVIVAFPAILLARKISSHLGRKVIQSRTESASRMLEYLRSIRLVKAFGLAGEKFKRLEAAFSRLRHDSIRMEFSTGLGVVLGEMILFAGIPLLMAFGFTLLKAGEIGIPVYIMFLMIAPKIYDPIATVITLSAMISFYGSSVERIQHIMDTEPLLVPEKTLSPAGNDIAFSHVTFRYENLNVLSDISFHVPEKTVTALVGPSGSGKTTVIRLIARFWDVSKGKIMIGGTDIRSITPEDLMARISIVFQDVYLFNDTVYNNIRFGREGTTKEDVIQAAKLACCHDFISALPEGYDSMIGEGGCTLSGGEKQRISIARAILKDAPIILLDEATASLDPENEAHIQTALNHLVKDKTLIVIAHRLKTIAGADQILVLEDGRIEECGLHSELLDRSELYARMWHEQMRTKQWKIK